MLNELRQFTSHPTAGELYKVVRRQLPQISLGTVYRNLELLVEMGQIQKLKMSGSEARFDGNPLPHSHFRCLRCRRLGDLEEAPYDRDRSYPREMDGHEILGCRVEFFGLCPDCRNATTRKGDR